MERSGFTSEKAYSLFTNSSLLTDTDRQQIEFYKKNDWVNDMRLKLPTRRPIEMRFDRDHDRRTSVSLMDELTYEAIGLCENSKKQESHYLWKIEKDFRGTGLGTFIRAVKESIDGTLEFEHAVGKKLAIPLISWGYVPIAVSTGDFEDDFQHRVNDSLVLEQFSHSYGYALKNPVWFEYNPSRAKQFMQDHRDAIYSGTKE